ncbi:hypothetical protein CapIbe_007720 [Capra ibex]
MFSESIRGKCHQSDISVFKCTAIVDSQDYLEGQQSHCFTTAFFKMSLWRSISSLSSEPGTIQALGRQGSHHPEVEDQAAVTKRLGRKQHRLQGLWHQW